MQASAAATLDGNPVEVGAGVAPGAGSGVGLIGSGMPSFRGIAVGFVKATPRAHTAFLFRPLSAAGTVKPS